MASFTCGSYNHANAFLVYDSSFGKKEVINAARTTTIGEKSEKSRCRVLTFPPASHYVDRAPHDRKLRLVTTPAGR